MWHGTANSGGWRSPQASAGTPNNTRELARSGKKKPQPRTVGVSLLVEPASTNLIGKTRMNAGFHRSASCHVPPDMPPVIARCPRFGGRRMRAGKDRSSGLGRSVDIAGG